MSEQALHASQPESSQSMGHAKVLQVSLLDCGPQVAPPCSAIVMTDLVFVFEPPVPQDLVQLLYQTTRGCHRVVALFNHENPTGVLTRPQLGDVGRNCWVVCPAFCRYKPGGRL